MPVRSIMLLHSAHDEAVPLSQSEEMANVLTKLGKPQMPIRMAGVDQSSVRGRTRVAVLSKIGRFLYKFLH